MTSQKTSRWLRLAAALAAVATFTAACGSDGDSGGAAGETEETSQTPADGAPLVFGSAGMLTGPLAQPQVQDAIKAYFDDWNERGGVNGRPVQLLVGDAGSDPTAAASAAQDLVQGRQVLALVGNSSLFDCLVNGELYATEQVANIALPFDVTCGTNPSVFPIAGPPALTYTSVAMFAVEQGAEKVAFLGVDAPGIADAGAATDAYYQDSGQAATVVSQLVPLTATGADIDAFIAQVKSKAVDTVTLLVTPPIAQLALQQAAASGVGPSDGVTWILNSANYDSGIFGSFGDVAEGAYVECNTYCWEHDDDEVAGALSILEEAGVDPINGLVGWAWQSAAILERALSEVDGDITRESVHAALKALSGIQPALAPYSIDYSKDPSPEAPRPLPSGGQIVQWAVGGFTVASDYLIVEP